MWRWRTTVAARGQGATGAFSPETLPRSTGERSPQLMRMRLALMNGLIDKADQDQVFLGERRLSLKGPAAAAHAEPIDARQNRVPLLHHMAGRQPAGAHQVGRSHAQLQVPGARPPP